MTSTIPFGSQQTNGDRILNQRPATRSRDSAAQNGHISDSGGRSSFQMFWPRTEQALNCLLKVPDIYWVNSNALPSVLSPSPMLTDFVVRRGEKEGGASTLLVGCVLP